MARLVVERVHRTGLDDLARVHHGRPPTDLGDDGKVVGDEQDGEAEVVRERAQELEDLGLHHDVERGRGLVGQQYLRVARERHRDRRPLAHPAGELVRVPGGARCRNPDPLEELGHAPTGVPALGDAV